LAQAAYSARDNDTIEIASGTYRECAVWWQSNLTIVAVGPVVLAETVCERKAIFVTRGHDITIRGITFTGAKAYFNNGAGIRAEGRNLTVENSTFFDNEEGILTSGNPDSTITIRNSTFTKNGNCLQDCAHGIYAGRIKELRIEGSGFTNQKIGHHVKSRALRTVLIGNTIRDGIEGTASYLVDIPNGGALIMRDNTLEKGRLTDNPDVAITLGEEGNSNVTPEIVIENNRFTNSMPTPTIFVRNRTETNAVLRGNTLSGKVVPLTGPGMVEGGNFERQ